jgi:adenylosuccinate lyase
MEDKTTTRSIFQNISPLDHRYSLSEKPVFDALVPYLSEDASISACVRCEIALVNAYLKVRGESRRLEPVAVDPAEVYKEEEKTKHNIRALVNVLKTKVPADLAPLVHLGATSVDILDTSLAFRMKGAAEKVMVPLLQRLENALCDLAEREADTPQVGRTHGQHAVPITFGFAMAEYVARLGKSIAEIGRRAEDLRGKLAGATGSYNATSMIVADPASLEKAYLDELGLQPSEHSTQLVEPEYLLRLLLEYNTAFGVIANLADDLRNLQRSEIGEVREGFAATQVGSSTMPQKRNPWNSEHVKSLWKAFMPRVVSFYMDQISEHQRDLTNSASQRFIAEFITGFAMAVSRMTDVVSGLTVNRDRMMANLLDLNSGAIPGGVLAEPAYILLGEAGESNGHEIIRRVTLKAETEHLSFAEALKSEPETLAKIAAQMAKIGVTPNATPDTALAWFAHPEKYAGLAAQKARALAAKYKKN